ncbi:hypothetical protein AGDE_10536 [Angomonas deanei]|nr:hypothetical protein AGDE_10536 [Angomonas deanei]|eukprot:EPY28129.1 hypothetical protein AGDE_10536 [Angomonas deanei]
MVDEILGGVQEAFTTDFDDMSWHGGLLAFAELCRRGVLPAAYLEEVVPVIAKGLAFDWSKGTYSVGAHVRDAASYVCWSLARAYDAADIEPHVYRLSVTLVITSLFDREVNVRRAASAAFQECVGRLGNFPHGIDLVTTMDFFSLSSLKSSYLEVAPKVAQFEAYRPSMLSALVETKLSHWDTAVRQCAAGALGELAVLEVQYMHENVFPVLLERVVDPTVAIRHGALLGIVHLIRRLPMESWTKEELSDIAEIVVRLDAARLFRSRGGEYIREACCLILSACADVQLPLPELVTFTKISGEKGRAKTHKKVQEFYEDTWKNILEWVQRSATDSFSKYAQVYYREYDPAFHSKVLAKIMEGCGPGNPLERRGFLSAAGGVPPSWLMAKDVSDDTYYYYQQLMKVLQEAALVDPTSDAELADAETRRNAVYSIGGILSKLPDGATVDRQWFADVSGTLLHSIQDYAVDKRGDVGSFVRLATLEIFPLVVQKGLTLSVCSDAIFLKFLKAVIRCAMEKLDKVRAAAVRTAQRLLGDCDWLSLFPESDERREIQFCQQLIQETAKEVVDISSPQLILSALAPPLLESCPVVFSYSVMEGLIVSAGDLSEHIRRPATGVLRDSFRGSSATETVSERQARLSRYLVEIGEGYVHCERVLVPLSRALDICVNDAVFALSCQMRVVEILRAELRHYATTIQVLLPLTSLLATMGRCGDPAAREATWKLLLTMIASRYPKVRGKVATEFYTSLLVLSSTGETAGVDAERCHRAMEHLSKVQWDGSDAGKIRSARNALYEILDIAPSAKVEGDTEMTSVKANNSSKAAVAGSYLHLVREAGY